MFANLHFLDTSVCSLSFSKCLKDKKVKWKESTNCTDLDLSENSLTDLPHDLVILKNLTKINLSGNTFHSYPVLMLAFTKLEHVDLGCNQLRSFPCDLGALPNLQYLNVSTNQIESIPRTVNGFDNLVTLLLDNNQLRAFPMQFGKCSKLKRLSIENNIIWQRDYEEEFVGFENLEELITSICYVPSSISTLKNLRHFVSSVHCFPDEIMNLTNLDEVIIYKVREISPAFHHYYQCEIKIGHTSPILQNYFDFDKKQQMDVLLKLHFNQPNIDISNIPFNKKISIIDKKQKTSMEIVKNDFGQYSFYINLQEINLSELGVLEIGFNVPSYCTVIDNVGNIWTVNDKLMKILCKIPKSVKLKQIQSIYSLILAISTEGKLYGIDCSGKLPFRSIVGNYRMICAIDGNGDLYIKERNRLIKSPCNFPPLVKVEMTSHCAVLLDENGDVWFLNATCYYSSGNKDWMELVTSDTLNANPGNKAFRPVSDFIPNHLPFVDIIGTDVAFFLIDINGTVYSFGANNYNQLGKEISSDIKCFEKSIVSNVYHIITECSIKRQCTIFIDNDFTFWITGYNAHWKYDSFTKPTKIDLNLIPLNKKVKKVN